MSEFFESLGFMLELGGQLSSSRASSLTILCILALMPSAIWLIAELVLRAAMPDPPLNAPLVIVLSLAVGLAIPLVLFWLRVVHSYAFGAFVVIVLALALLFSAATFFGLRKYQAAAAPVAPTALSSSRPTQPVFRPA
ncbi:hypothetical protein [Hymenobacter sp. B81]|uniref:hypothetical protein n=1 Tax=Hymenobacter sp. B81 TaxID=3344878 RepID=UPI0037DD496D